MLGGAVNVSTFSGDYHVLFLGKCDRGSCFSVLAVDYLFGCVSLRNMVYVETITSDRSCFQVIVGPYFVGLHWSASVGVGVVVDEDGLSGGGGDVVVVVVGDGEVVDGLGSSGGLDRHHWSDVGFSGSG